MKSGAVIFVPGVKGTKLVETNRTPFDTIWSGVQSNFESIQDLELSASQEGVYFDEKITSIIGAGEIEELAYAEFLRDLTTEKPKFIFNYDWRLSAGENGERLSEFVDYLTAKSVASKDTPKFKLFDFITHSLGNFIVRNYLHRNGFDRVNKIVFTVPPFKGSLDIVTTATIGEGWFPNVKSRIRKIIRTMPDALELLPTYAGASKFVPSANHDFFTFNHWQGNLKDPSNSVSAKMQIALKEARKLVKNQLQDISALSSAQRKRILVIARDGFDTLQAVKVRKNGPDGVQNFVDLDNALENSQGDGRVPHVSSCCYFGPVKTLMLNNATWYQAYRLNRPGNPGDSNT